MQDKARANAKISFELETVVDEIKDTARGVVTGIVLRNVKTGAVKELAVDGVFIAIGHTPNTGLVRGRLESRRERLYRAAARRRDERARGVRVRGRPGSRLPAGDYRRRIGVHGGD